MRRIAFALIALACARGVAHAEDEGIEVEVRGEARAESSTPLSAREVRELPGAFGDALRAVEILPGVTPVASGVPYFFVRGAPPANVGYFLDGVRVPLLFHVALGPSVIHPSIVERVDLHSGAFPARYGRYAGGIVTAETAPPSPVLRGETSVRLYDTGALVEVPFDGGRGAALAAYRYSYTGAVLSLLSPEVDLSYWDYQARLHYELDANDSIGLFAFGSHDALSTTDDAGGEVQTVLDADFHRVDLRWDHRFDADARMRTAATFGYDRSSTDRERRNARSFSGTLRNEGTYGSGGVVLRAGADAVVERFEFEIGGDDASAGSETASLRASFHPRTDVTFGAYAELALSLAKRLEIVPGLRVDLFSSGETLAVGIDPRLSARARISDRLTLSQSVGIASQRPSFLGAIPGLQPDLTGGLQRSLLTSVTAEIALPEDVTARVTFFRNGFFEMTDALGNRVPAEDTTVSGALAERSLGDAHGIEISLRRPLGRRLGGFFSYTLSRSTRELDGVSFDHPFDRRHVVQGALAHDLGRGWRLGQRFVFYTGVPTSIDYRLPPGATTPPDDDVTPEEALEEALKRERERRALRRLATEEDLPERLPPFFRVDLRVEKRWVFAPYWLSFVAEVQNLMGARETLQYRCSLEEGCAPTTLGPIVIPSIGIEGGI